MGAMHILNNYIQLRVRQTIMPLLHLFAVGDAQPTEARRFVDLRALVFDSFISFPLSFHDARSCVLLSCT